ncbi:hypothetical protein NQ314_007554 [Rhamnusium bicolor]|uniref:Uncharacterized protein n=1 Tax=Rhamnusium bicolor TaxID=1586634 RepID=A0AAV8YLA1_9CUCU|nr:hypothetical protein NQ314_007554 [Rhamnusium bicolor]
MEKGTAVEFKKNFGKIEELRSQNKDIGEVAQIRQGKRNIYYLITKERYSDKPTYIDVWETLELLRQLSEENVEQKIAMPKNGCCLDGL